MTIVEEEDMDYEDFLAKVEREDPEQNVWNLVNEAILCDVAVERRDNTPSPTYDRGGITNIRHNSCVYVLDGENSRLLSAFDWCTTPEGSPYWADRCHGFRTLSYEDYEFIRSLIA